MDNNIIPTIAFPGLSLCMVYCRQLIDTLVELKQMNL